MEAIDWDSVLANNNVDVKIDKFYEVVDNIMQENIPKRKVITTSTLLLLENGTVD